MWSRSGSYLHRDGDIRTTGLYMGTLHMQSAADRIAAERRRLCDEFARKLERLAADERALMREVDHRAKPLSAREAVERARGENRNGLD